MLNFEIRGDYFVAKAFAYPAHHRVACVFRGSARAYLGSRAPFGP